MMLLTCRQNRYYEMDESGEMRGWWEKMYRGREGGAFRAWEWEWVRERERQTDRQTEREGERERER